MIPNRIPGILLATLALGLGMGNLSADLGSDIKKAEKIAHVRDFHRVRSALAALVEAKLTETEMSLRKLGYTMALSTHYFTRARNSEDLQKEYTTICLQLEEVRCAFTVLARMGHPGHVSKFAMIYVMEDETRAHAYFNINWLFVCYNMHGWATRSLRATWNWLSRVNNPSWIDHSIAGSDKIIRAMLQVP